MVMEHPEFGNNPEWLLYRCWDSSIMDQVDLFEHEMTLEQRGELDQAGVEALTADDLKAFKLDKHEVPDLRATAHTKDEKDDKDEKVKKAQKDKDDKKDKKDKKERSEVDKVRAAVKARVRNCGDWRLESAGWPQQLADSACPKDLLPSMNKTCEEWATKWATSVEHGEKLLVQKDVTVEPMQAWIDQTNMLKDSFNEFLAVNKKFVSKPSAKAKGKAKAKVAA